MTDEDERPTHENQAADARDELEASSETVPEVDELTPPLVERLDSMREMIAHFVGARRERRHVIVSVRRHERAPPG
jgi:hypothetical protein